MVRAAKEDKDERSAEEMANTPSFNPMDDDVSDLTVRTSLHSYTAADPSGSSSLVPRISSVESQDRSCRQLPRALHAIMPCKRDSRMHRARGIEG